jgi:hypothetical protein
LSEATNEVFFFEKTCSTNSIAKGMKFNHNAPESIDIVKKAALKPGGSVRVASKTGQSSTFHVEIPGKLQV